MLSADLPGSLPSSSGAVAEFIWKTLVSQMKQNTGRPRDCQVRSWLIALSSAGQQLAGWNAAARISIARTYGGQLVRLQLGLITLPEQSPFQKVQEGSRGWSVSLSPKGRRGPLPQSVQATPENHRLVALSTDCKWRMKRGPVSKSRVRLSGMAVMLALHLDMSYCLCRINKMNNC